MKKVVTITNIIFTTINSILFSVTIAAYVFPKFNSLPYYPYLFISTCLFYIVDLVLFIITKTACKHNIYQPKFLWYIVVNTALVLAPIGLFLLALFISPVV